MSRTLREIQTEVNEWGYEAFPNSTPLSCAKHLHEEAHELLGAITSPAIAKDRRQIGGEIADVLMLAMQVAGRLGMQVDELIEQKMAKNRARTWQYDPALGYSTHVEEVQS